MLVLERGERLVQRHAGSAGIGEDHVHAVIDQRLHENIGPADHLCGASRLADRSHDKILATGIEISRFSPNMLG